MAQTQFRIIGQNGSVLEPTQACISYFRTLSSTEAAIERANTVEALHAATAELGSLPVKPADLAVTGLMSGEKRERLLIAA